ncbi:MAG: hypothetical protein H6850_01080 [Alphaproteobacteria bacterium]|nr:MAG: hypothetical protein H6850_01080 [Alphaproteobacteria bacterium]
MNPTTYPFVTFDGFRFFGTSQFYTLFILTTFFLDDSEIGKDLIILLSTSAGILYGLKWITTFVSNFEYTAPSVTTGVSTSFFLFVMQRRMKDLFTVFAGFIWLSVHGLYVLDSYFGNLRKTSIHALTGTALGAVIYWVYDEVKNN